MKTLLSCIASLLLGILTSWLVLRNGSSVQQEEKNKQEEAARGEARAKQDLALIIGDCKRMDTTVPEIASSREIVVRQIRDKIQSLHSWRNHHLLHPQMEIATEVSVALEISADRIEQGANSYAWKLAEDRLRDAQKKASDCFSILTGGR